MRSPTRPATDEIGMRCKSLFYFSRWQLVFGRWLLVVGNTIPRSLANDDSQSWDVAFPLCHRESLMLTNDQRRMTND
jgi:hypothetical protein